MSIDSIEPVMWKIFKVIDTPQKFDVNKKES